MRKFGDKFGKKYGAGDEKPAPQKPGFRAGINTAGQPIGWDCPPTAEPVAKPVEVDPAVNEQRQSSVFEPEKS